MPSRVDLAKIHIAKKELGIDEESYRAILRRRYRRDSAADLSDSQAADLVGFFRSFGWRPRRPSGPHRRASFAQQRLIRLLWRRLIEAGAVERRGEESLERFAGRVAGVEDLARLDVRQASNVIEGLKNRLARAEKKAGGAA